MSSPHTFPPQDFAAAAAGGGSRVINHEVIAQITGTPAALPATQFGGSNENWPSPFTARGLNRGDFLVVQAAPFNTTTRAPVSDTDYGRLIHVQWIVPVPKIDGGWAYRQLVRRTNSDSVANVQIHVSKAGGDTVVIISNSNIGGGSFHYRYTYMSIIEFV